MWLTDKIQPFTRNSLLQLIENRVPAVKISSFADSQEVIQFSNELLNLEHYSQSIPEVMRLGVSQYQDGLCESKAEYFDSAQRVSDAFKSLFEKSFNPLDRIIDHLCRFDLDARIMDEPGYGNYFAGAGKMRNGYSPIHVDFAPQDSTGWAVESTVNQLAWNFYLKIPDEGGELLLWDKMWQPEDDTHQVSDSYHYRRSVVNNLEPLLVPVNFGEVILINSRNFHAVNNCEDRLAFGSFISVLPDNSLRFWS